MAATLASYAAVRQIQLFRMNSLDYFVPVLVFCIRNIIGLCYNKAVRDCYTCSLCYAEL